MLYFEVEIFYLLKICLIERMKKIICSFHQFYERFSFYFTIFLIYFKVNPFYFFWDEIFIDPIPKFTILLHNSDVNLKKRKK